LDVVSIAGYRTGASIAEVIPTDARPAGFCQFKDEGVMGFGGKLPTGVS
jgi:hypothetical protein